MSNSINDIILKTITDNNMIVSNDKIVVGVSGGADSMCLLHFLISIKYKFLLILLRLILTITCVGQKLCVIRL